MSGKTQHWSFEELFLSHRHHHQSLPAHGRKRLLKHFHQFTPLLEHMFRIHFSSCFSACPNIYYKSGCHLSLVIRTMWQAQGHFFFAVVVFAKIHGVELVWGPWERWRRWAWWVEWRRGPRGRQMWRVGGCWDPEAAAVGVVVNHQAVGGDPQTELRHNDK